MANDRTLVQVEALADFRTSGLPDGRYTFPNEPLVFKGDVFYVTRAQLAYLGPKVKVVSEDAPDAKAYHDYALSANYHRLPSPYPHHFEPGMSTSEKPDQALMEARLAATTFEVTVEDSGSPTGQQSDSPNLDENESEVRTRETHQRTRRTRRVTPPAEEP